MAKYGLGKSSATDNIFSDSPEDVSSFINTENRSAELLTDQNYYGITNLSDKKSTLSLDEARGHIFSAEKNIYGMINEIENNLSQVVLDPYSNIELEKSHLAVWKDIVKNVDEAKDKVVPDFVCYEQYQHAENHKCRACRSFIKEYDLAISHSTFGHLIECKKVLQFILNELIIIKNIIINYLGDDYRDEDEEQITKYLTDWAKTANHYTKQVAKEITSTPVSIPEAELDQISKKQAAQFQAFFSIKINSYTTEIQTLLNLIKRDSIDTAETFYANYLMPALNIKSKVIEPIMMDITTTQLAKQIPTLLKEVYVANSAVTGNLGAVTADLLERNNQIYKRFDAFLQAVRLKRRYVNYLVQLEAKAVKRPSIIILETIEDLETYKDYFTSMPIDSSSRANLRSSHNVLDDVDGDPHPQYLKVEGGIISGDIEVKDGIKIGGIELAEHTHSGEDGSKPIDATAIDFNSARNRYYDLEIDKPYGQLKLTSLNSSVLIGGVPQYEAVFEIEIDDDKINSYEFEILYKEL